ncbi:hypothetical protein IAU60_000851 [Kwoniella sp. DSM 27419]
MASNILPLFWPLANSSKDTRLTASASLISSLENFQQSYVSSRPSASTSKGNAGEADEEEDEDDEEEDEEADDDDDDESGMEVDASDDEEGEARDVQAVRLDKRLSKDNAEDVVYCVKRLVRGLGSSREHSRLGFAVALTELLARIQSVTASQVLSLLIRNSQYSKNMKGSDERDMMFARLFGLTSIVQSKSLFNASARKEDFERVVQELITLGQGKAWIRESAWWIIVGAVKALLESEVEWKDEALQGVAKNVFGDKAWTQEKVALVLLLEDKVPQLDWKAYLAPTFKHTPLLNSHNLVTLGRVLKEASAEDDEGVAASVSGSWKPQLHFVWNIILEHYFPSSGESPAASSEAPFQDFFRVVVDESLFSNTASPQRRYWGFQVFERALPLLPAGQMPLIFTPNFMRCWMNNLSSSDRYLHKAALAIAKKVQEVTKQNPKVGFTLLSQLVGKHGRQDFDKVTKTKTVESILSSLNAEGVTEYVKYLQEIILHGGENMDSGRVDERRTWALDQILALCRNGSVPKDDAWIASILDFLLVHGFFLVRKADKKSPIAALHSTPKPALSEVTAATCRTRFTSCLLELTTASVSQRGSDENKVARQQGCDVSGKLWLQRVLDTIAQLEGNKKHVEVVTDADDEIKKIRQTGLDTLTELRKADKADKEVSRGAEILLAFFVLQTYDEVDDALDMLENAVSASRKLFDLPTAEEDEEDDVAPIDSLLDVLIALLDKGSNDLRNLANLVFGMVSSAFTESSIKLLTAQLEQNVAETAAAEGSDEGEDDDEEAEEEDEEDEDDDEEDEESEDDDVDEDEDDLAPVDPAFRARVAEALQVSGMGVDENAQDGDSDEEDEDVWDDEQMMKVDEQLAEVFRQQASGTKRSDMKHLQIESLHFKNRILDFFDVYAKRQLTNPLVLSVLLALLKLVRASGTSEGELANKAAGILRSRFNKPKDVPSSVDAEEAGEILDEVHAMAQKAFSAEFSNLCSLASLFVVRAIDAASGSGSTAVTAYGKTLKDFMTRKSSLVHPGFVSDFIKRFPVRAFPLHADLAKYVIPGAGVNAYRQTQAYGMLQTLSQHLPVIAKSPSTPSADIESFVKTCSEGVLATLEASASSSKEDASQAWNAQKLKDVVKFALQLARASKTVNAAWDLERVTEVERALKAGERTKEMKGVLSMWAQLLSVLGQKKEKVDKKAAGKRKADGQQPQEEDKMDVDEGVSGEAETTGQTTATNASQPAKTKKHKSEDAVKSKKRKVDADGKKKKVKASS